MNTAVRISVRATFGDTMARFRELQAMIKSLDAQTSKLNTSLTYLGDKFDRNAAKAERWGATLAAAAAKAQAVGMISGPKGTPSIPAAVPTGIKGTGLALDELGQKWIAAGTKATRAGALMTFTVTGPLALAFREGYKQDLAYTSSLTQLQQAYNEVGAGVGDLAARQRAWAADNAGLQKVVLTLSNGLGLNRAELTATAAEFARAGDRSLSLAKDLQTAASLQRTYSLSARESVDIVTQMRTAWGLSADAARDNANALTLIQESGRGTFSQLVAGINRASQPARLLGLTYKQLAAYQAILLQSGYLQGGTAGNSLTAIFSRLVQVVPKARDQLAQYGIEVNKADWLKASGAQKLQMIADVWGKLTLSQKQALGVSLAGERQYRALVPILDDLANKNGKYNTIMRDTANASNNAAFAQHQLALALKTPQASLDVLKTTFQNTLGMLAQQLLPTIIAVGNTLVGLARAFGSLPPGLRTVILIGLAIAALSGPILAITGGFRVMAGVAVRALGMILTILPETMGPFLLIGGILAVVTLAIVAFHGKTLAIFKDLAMGLGFIVHAIYQLFQWINPFARHSPSLVENVSNGVDQMLADFTRLRAGVSPIMGNIGSLVEATGSAAANMGGGAGPTPTLNNARNTIVQAVKVGASDASSIALFDQGIRALHQLSDAMSQVGKTYDMQSARVENLKRQMEATNGQLTLANVKLKELNQRRAELTERRSKHDSPAALLSQAEALRDMGRAIAGAGNAALARRYEEQASALQKSAVTAQGLDGQLASVNEQIDAQQAVVDSLTTAHDKLTTAYQDENTKLSDLRAGYGEIKAQYTQLQQNLLAMAQAARTASTALKNMQSAAGPTGISSTDQFGKSQLGDLNKFAANLQKSLGGLKAPNLGKFLDELKKGWNQGWANFGKQSLPARIFESPIITALALASPFIIKKAAELLFNPLSMLLGSKGGGGIIGKLVGLGKGAATGDAVAEGAAVGERAAGGILSRFVGLGGRLLKMAFGGLASLVVTVVPELIAAASEAVFAMVTGVAAVIGAVPLAIVAGILAIGTLIWVFRKPLEHVGALVVEWIWKAIQVAAKAVWDFAKIVWHAFQDGANAAAGFLRRTGTDIVHWVWEALQKAWNSYVDFSRLIAQALSKAAAAIGGALVSFGRNLVQWLWVDGIVKGWNAIVNFDTFIVGKVAGWAGSALKAMVNFGASLVGGIWNGIQTAWHFISDGLTGLVSGLGSMIAGVIKTPVDGIIGLINGALNFISGIGVSYGGLKVAGVTVIPGFNFHMPNMGQIPLLANGGIVNNPTLAMMGERGPEAVLPLSASNPFIDMFAKTVASRMGSSMERYAKAGMATGGYSMVNSHNTTNNVTINVTAPPHVMSGSDMAKELGAVLAKRGVR